MCANRYVLVLRPLGYKSAPWMWLKTSGEHDGASIEVTEGKLAQLSGLVVYGKLLPKKAVTRELVHRIAGHGRRRDLLHLSEAWSDASWSKELFEGKAEETCEACFRANRPKSSPGGELPTAQGLYYMDIWHVSLPAHFGGERTVIGITHAATGFNKTVGIKYKSQAADAMHVMLAFCNASGQPIKWLHTNNAPELKGAGMIEIANNHQIRITTSTVGNSQQNLMEPNWRANTAAMRTEFKQSRLPYAF